MSVKILCVVYVISCCILCIACQGWVIDDDGCRTPDQGVGMCTLIKNCGMIVSFLQSAPKPLSPVIKQKLREYICGYEGGDVKVCCPGRPLPLTSTLTKVPDESKDEDSISSHINLSLLPTECGYMGIPDKISYGENAGLGEYPWMALLSYKTSNGPQFRCGGTVINNKYILTAAHCITQLQDPLLGVRVGDYDLSTKIDCEEQADGNTRCIREPVQDLAIEKVIVHPKFTKDYNNTDGFNDIGLIRVSRMKFVENVQPICLPVGEVRNSELSRVIITGWGFTERESKVSNILQKVTLPVISHRECQKAYTVINISKKQICANGKQQDTCKGDSGGPLQTAKYINDDTRMVQYGVISFGGANCGSGAFPGLYTRVDSYIKWILDNIAP